MQWSRDCKHVCQVQRRGKHLKEELALVLNKEVQVEACLVSKKSAIILEDNTAHCTALKTLLQFIGNM